MIRQNEFFDLPIIDGHFHMYTPLEDPGPFDYVDAVQKECRLEKTAVMSLTAAAQAGAFNYKGHGNENMVSLYCKHRRPGRIYAFGGLQYEDWAGDPPSMWQNGTYDNSYPKPDELYQTAVNILDRHKEMPVVFAHFFFQSADRDRAAMILEKYPNVRFDLTPGQGMYRDFTKDPARWKDFFIHYADRIIFGTDNHGERRHFPGDAPDEYYPEPKVRAMRRFLETGDSFTGWNFPITGLKLPESVLRKIYRDNFAGLAGAEPAAVDYAFCRSYYAELLNSFSKDRNEYMLSQIGLFLDNIS